MRMDSREQKFFLGRFCVPCGGPATAQRSHSKARRARACFRRGPGWLHSARFSIDTGRED
jgi:hypothetical protein